MATKKKDDAQVEAPAGATVGINELAKALVQAIEITKPVAKKTTTTRKKGTPWTPKDGSPKLKLKRKSYHHGLLMENRLSNDEISLLNKIKPGTYCDGWVQVIKRKDKGINIDYPIKTSSQRLKLVNQFGIRNFKELLERIIDEQSNPTLYKVPEDTYDEE